MIRRLGALVLSSALVLLPLVLTAPTVAEAAPSAGHELFTGYLLSLNPMPTFVDDYYAFSTKTTADISLSYLGTGKYKVVFGLPGKLAAPTVVVSAFDAKATCEVAHTVSNSTHLTVDVHCYTFRGSPENSIFAMIVGNGPEHPAGLVDYAGVTGQHVVVSYNSSHKSNKVVGLGTGRYALTFGGPGTSGVTGTVHVTTAGSAGANCVVAGWHGTAAGEVVDVDCFAASGLLRNESFFVGYARHSNLTGIKGASTADAFAARPTAHMYVPAVQDNSTPGARVRVQRAERGNYLVIFAKSGGPYNVNGGDAQVVAVGTRDRHCDVENWMSNANGAAVIDCYDNSGHRADSQFAVQWMVDS
jgi:hypothetical protein